MARHTGRQALEHFLLDIAGIAKSVARKYPGVEQDDLYQGLAEWLLKNGHRLKLEETKGCKYILTRAAHIMAGQERADALLKSVQYSYKSEDVRRILETVFFDPELWMHAHVPEDAESIKYGTDALDVTFDVQLALRHLPILDSQSIFDFFCLGKVPAPNSAERKRLDRAVSKLTDVLNSYEGLRREQKAFSGGPGSRRVITNAQATATIQNDSGAR